MNKKTLGWIVAALACIGAAAWYLTKSPPPPAAGKQGGGGQPPTVVNLVSPLRQDVPILLQANGTVMPVSSVDLHPQTTNTIRTVHIKEGQFVKAGDLLFTLDDRSARADVAKAQAQLARDQAALLDLERQHQRSKELLARNFIAQGAVDTLTSQVESQRALLKADLAAIQATQVAASYAAIRAPMAGRVGAINVFPGSLVQLSTSLATVTQLNPITVGFTLPENNLPALLAAQKSGKVAVQALLPGQEQPLEGMLSFIDNAVDPVTGAIRLKAQFDNRDTRLWPGQYVNTRVTVQTLKDALVIPQAAIITNTRGSFVYTMEPDQTAQTKTVARVHAFGLNAVVTGLAGTEKIIVEGKQNLRPGAKVRVAQAPGPQRRGSGPSPSPGRGPTSGAAQ
jgi:membrane fusion protein, multidrug efflux system